MTEYEMDVPMKWDEFKRLPKQAQEEYIQGLIEKFNVTSVGLAEMFGASALTVRKYLSSEHNIRFTRGKNMKPFEEIAWNAFINQSPELTGSERLSDETRLVSFSMEFSGKLDVDDLYNSLKMILGDSPNGRIEIVCNLS